MKMKIQLSKLSKETQAKIRKELADTSTIFQPDLKAIQSTLQKEVKARTGWDVPLTVTLDKDRFDKPVIKVTSEELVDRLGVKGLFSSLAIKDFGGGTLQNDNTIWIPLNWRWKHPDGGSNGTNLVETLLTPEGKLLKAR